MTARDGTGRPTDVEQTVPGGSAVEGYHYTYDAAGRVTQLDFRRKPGAGTAWSAGHGKAKGSGVDSDAAPLTPPPPPG